MNTCPVYRRSGGYSYTYFIPGPIGVSLDMARDAKQFSDNVSACSLCCSCENVCPAKVNLSEQIYAWRQSLKDIGRAVLFISECLVIIIDRKDIVSNMHQAYERIENPGYGCFISGPSKTADIAQALVMGAQAARDVTVIIR